MRLRDLALPLVTVRARDPQPSPGHRSAVAPDRPADPRVSFSTAYRYGGWRQAVDLRDQQRRLQRGKGVR